MATDNTVQTDKTESSKTGLGSTAMPSDKDLAENSKESLDEKLDHGSQESFPASDPVSVKITK